MMERTETILTYKQAGDRTWWDRFFVQIPDDVQRRMAVAKHAQQIAADLAPLKPEANREILEQVARLLGVDKP